MARRIIKAPNSITLHDAFKQSGEHSKTLPPKTNNYEKPIYDNRSHWTSSFTKWVFEVNRIKKGERPIDEGEETQLYVEGKTAEEAIEELKYWAKNNFSGSGKLWVRIVD